MIANDLSKYVIAEDSMSLVIGGGIRNIMTSDARLLISHYRNKNPQKLVELVETAFKYMIVLSNDASPEAIGECTRIFEFICLVIEEFGGEYRISEALGYRVRINHRSPTEIDKQIVEVRYNKPADEDDDDMTNTIIGGND